MPKKFGEEGWGYHDFTSKIFCLIVSKISVGESSIVALVWGAEKILEKRGGGGGVSRFPVEFFLSHRAENFRKGILYCCNNFGYRKSLEKRGEEYQDFPSKIFCLTVPKVSLGESSVVAFFLGTEKIWRRGGRGVSRFSIKFFCPWGILYCCINFGYRKSLDRRGWGGGVPRNSVENFSAHSAESFLRVILCCCINFRYRKSLEKSGGGIMILRRKFFVS